MWGGPRTCFLNLSFETIGAQISELYGSNFTHPLPLTGISLIQQLVATAQSVIQESVFDLLVLPASRSHVTACNNIIYWYNYKLCSLLRVLYITQTTVYLYCSTVVNSRLEDLSLLHKYVDYYHSFHEIMLILWSLVQGFSFCLSRAPQHCRSENCLHKRAPAALLCCKFS